MAEVSQKHLDKIDKIAVLVANMSENLSGVPASLKDIGGVLDSHTTTLDAIAKNTSTWEAEVKIIRTQMEKQEKAIKLLADKLNLDVQSLLN